MSYQGIDHDCDKPRQYKMLREAMAKLYSCGDETNSLVLFPLMVSPHNFKDLTQSEQKSLKQNQKEETWWPGESTELNEKVKEIRQKFSKAVASQNRSGSDEF